ncbi:hypothetical protein PITCH_A1380047 [uncultured Desulfobacterium sp.]|uniref:Uncharacterized protein n=1 Tax=uncultured Desulfobacterium sp. TaxID=201089 RepID=A0A445MSW0_9BACT|nr:hypothetical protein PITCH_A1380047 [uncultured Desulfobacterium sp.]
MTVMILTDFYRCRIDNLIIYKSQLTEHYY